MSRDLSPSMKNIPFLKDAPARALRAAGREAKWFSIPAGLPLFEAGEPADSIFFVLAGSLGIFRSTEDGRNEFVAHVRAGEPVGEMALLGGSPHANSAYALRDTEVLKISRAGFDRLVKAEPEILERLVRVILVRLRQSGRRSPRSEPKVFTLVGTSPTIDLSLRANALGASLRQMGLRVAVVDEAIGGDKPFGFFDDLERQNDLVILTTPIGDTSWYRLATRQADRIWVLGRADARPSSPLMPKGESPAQHFKLVDVVLLHHDDRRRVARPADWLEASGGARIFHWRGVIGGDCQRIARVMAGRTVGLVLSGGGARAYAHVGVVRAMRERGLPIDFAGGCSMGAVIAACVAMGWDDDEIDRRIRKAFVESNPLGDFRLPIVSMVKGRRVDRRLKEHFDEARIGDLDIPYFAVSAALNDGTVKIHRRGLVRHALRATIALPGILPPVVDDGEILVDGGVLNNFPVDIMRDFHRGFIVGADVARQAEGLNPADFEHPPGFFGWVARNGFGGAPPIAGLLMRTATITVDPTVGRDLVDVLVLPKLGDIELRDWDAYDQTVEAGYEAAVKALDAGGDTIASRCNVEQPRAAGDTRFA